MKMSEDDRNPMRREYHHQKPKAPLLHQTNGGGANNPNNIDNDGLKTRDENAPMVEASKKSSVVPSSDNDSLSGKSRVKRAKLMYREIEELARERSGLSRRGLYYVCGMFVGLVLLVIVVVTLGACWPRVPHHQQYPVCTEAACLRASAQVREALDSSIQPCEDIYKWSCGGWLKDHPLPPDKSAWDQKYQLAKQESARIRELVTTLPLPVTTGTVNWKLKHFYEACLDVDNTNAEQARPLTSIISELGGWSILREWSMADFDYSDILQKLQVNYGISPYFKVSVGPNPGLPGANSIIISPSGLGLPDRSYYFGSYDNVVNAYKQLVRDVVINFRATAEEANKFGSDIFHYEKRIAEITPNSIDLLNPIAKYNPIKVSELKLTAATLPLYDLLSAMYPDANITADTEVLVTSTDYLLSISSIVASTDRTTINSYLMWTLVRAYLPYLSHDFTAAWDSFQSVLFGTSKYEPVQRWEFCANLVKKYMSVAVEYKFSENIYNSSFAVEEMFQNIKKSAIGKLNKYRSMPDLYRHLTRKISGLKLQVGLPVREDPHFLQNYYSRLTILKKNLFTSYTKSVIFSKKLEESRLKKPEVDDYLIELSGELNPVVHYVPSLNTVFVPNNLLSAPVYEENYPRPILYGRIGVDIANAVVSSILPYENTWTSELKLLSSFHSIVNDSIRTAEKTKKCMMNFVLSKHLTTDNFANTTSLNTVKQVAAVQLAFEALKLSSNINQHIHQPSLEKFEDEALFFISYSQSQCSNITIEQDVFDAITNFKLKKSAMLQTVWNQIAEFPESLNCNSNQQFKCSDLF